MLMIRELYMKRIRRKEKEKEEDVDILEPFVLYFENSDRKEHLKIRIKIR